MFGSRSEITCLVEYEFYHVYIPLDNMNHLQQHKIYIPFVKMSIFDFFLNSV